MRHILVGLGFSLVFLVPVIVFAWLVMGQFGHLLTNKNERALVFVVAAGFGALFVKWRRPQTSWLEAFVFSLLAYGAVYKAATFLPEVSTYPWSLGWSEGSRYFYASLFFSEKVYGASFPPSVLHPSRYLMQSLPFAISEAPLWLHRLWQVGLWLGFTLWGGIAIARRFKGGWGLALFSFLFMFQGPVYYHLMIMVILVVWGYDRQRPGWTMAIVLVASAWAGISRLNWFPVPGLLASTLYMLETPVERKSMWRYMLPMAAWTLLGTGVAFAAQSAYIFWSGNPVEQFGSSLTSDLLWYRLWPNATYGPGLLRSIWRISFPVLLLILARWLPNWRRYHPLRLLGFLAVIGVLFAGGIVVSVKIGGGSNLHNMDAYLVLLLVVGAGFYYHKIQPEIQLENQRETQLAAPLRSQGVMWPLVLFLILFLLRDLTQTGGKLPVYDHATAWQEIDILRQAVEEIALAGDETLFVDQRHLLSTHIVSNTPLVLDYEVVFLMEMVMANNTLYLEQLQQDLRQKRFGAIVMGTPGTHIQDQDNAFSEENNIWVEWVAIPILCYYETSVLLPDAGMSVMTPRATPCE
jgi:hypothetical protein